MPGRADVSGSTRVAAVVGAPVSHSLSPLLHNAWLAEAGIDGVYVAFAPQPDHFEDLVDGLRISGVAGINVTSPFKARALALADQVEPSAEAAGAANLLVFGARGDIRAINTDGLGLLAAFAEQAPSWTPTGAPAVILGAGGAARGAVAALTAAGGRVRIVNRTSDRAQALASEFTGASPFGSAGLQEALRGAGALINAAPAGSWDAEALRPTLDAMVPDAVVMDMVYTPVRTPLLAIAAAQGRAIVDGLAMLIGQGRPSFQALFGVEAPAAVDVRALALRALGERS